VGGANFFSFTGSSPFPIHFNLDFSTPYYSAIQYHYSSRESEPTESMPNRLKYHMKDAMISYEDIIP
jgi:hypothetical protein